MPRIGSGSAWPHQDTYAICHRPAELTSAELTKTSVPALLCLILLTSAALHLIASCLSCKRRATGSRTHVHAQMENVKARERSFGASNRSQRQPDLAYLDVHADPSPPIPCASSLPLSLTKASPPHLQGVSPHPPQQTMNIKRGNDSRGNTILHRSPVAKNCECASHEVPTFR